jgi:hypothetical protein
MKVVKLSLWLQLLVPLLAISSLSKSVRGLTLYPGKAGAALGAAIVACAGAVGYWLYFPLGAAGTVASVWLLGSAGVAMLVSGLRPTAFVKPICVRCRLLPVIKEHEALHLSGLSSEGAVWASMRARHSVESLALAGDSSICSFCPIPKRLSEH